MEITDKKDLERLAAIPLEVLLQDRKEALEDIEICKKALRVEVTHYSGGSVQKRLDKNKFHIKVMDWELKRRENGKPEYY